VLRKMVPGLCPPVATQHHSLNTDPHSPAPPHKAPRTPGAFIVPEDPAKPVALQTFVVFVTNNRVSQIAVDTAIALAM